MKQITALLSLIIIALSPLAHAGQYDDLSKASKLTRLLYSAAAAITGEFEGRESQFGRIFHSDDLEYRRGDNLSSAIFAGIKASEDPQLVALARNCEAAPGSPNRANCLKLGLLKVDSRTWVTAHQAAVIVKATCSNAQLFADAARCLRATVPLIRDPDFQNAASGCAAISDGESMTKCYLKALEEKTAVNNVNPD